MSKRVKYSVFSCFAVFLTLLVLASSNAFAHSLLSEIEIKNTDNEYNITLQVNDKTEVKKKVLSDDKILLTLQDTSQAEKVPVIYEGNADNIIIKDKKNNVEITLQGKNAEKSNIFVKEISSGLLKQVYSGNEKKSFISNGFYLLDAKFSSLIILGLVFMFTMFAFVKPKEGMNRISKFKNETNNNSVSKVATIRNKIAQKRNQTAPYIHYGANYTSLPNELVTNRYTGEKIKKYG